MSRMNMHMAAVDASPGSGAAPAPDAAAPTTDSAPAQGNPQELMAAFEARMESMRNGLFATVRKLIDERLPAPNKPSKSEAAKAEPTHSAADPTEVLTRLRAFDRSVTAASTRMGVQLGERAIARMEAAFKAESPDNVSEWVGSYLEDHGMARSASGNVKSEPVVTQPDTHTQPRSPVPVTAAGNPPPPRATPEELNLLESIRSQADLDALEKTKGRDWVVKQFRSQLKGTRIALK